MVGLIIGAAAAYYYRKCKETGPGSAQRVRPSFEMGDVPKESGGYRAPYANLGESQHDSA